MSDPGKRVPRQLVIDAELESLLAALTRREGKPASGHIDLDTLFSLEVSLGHPFADDLLAAFAADIPSLRASHGFGVADVMSHCGRLRDEGRRGDLIGIARTDESEYVVDKRTASSGGAVLCRLEVDGSGEVVEKLSVAEFLRRACGFTDDVAAASFSASLHRKPTMDSAPGRVVIHGKFGRGTAFSESGDGPTRKVTCDFPGVGLKVIQARFLEFDDEA